MLSMPNLFDRYQYVRQKNLSSSPLRTLSGSVTTTSAITTASLRVARFPAAFCASFTRSMRRCTVPQFGSPSRGTTRPTTS